MAETPRLRVVFEDRHLITKSQRSAGLRHCWLLLRPHLATVSDLANHIADAFALRRSCPDDLLLSMDGFVLPPFESANIFRDNDILWVKRREPKKKKLLEICDDTNREDSLVFDRDPTVSAVAILATRNSQDDLGADGNKIFWNEYENGDYRIKGQVATSEEVNLKRKRKCSDKEGSKKKKLKLASAKNVVSTDGKDETVLSTHKKKVSKKNSSSSKSVERTDKASKGVERFDSLDTRVDVDKSASSASKEERHKQVGDDCCKNEDHIIASTKKTPSRSARRKKAKRQWKREMAKEKIKENMQLQAMVNDDQGTPSKQKGLDQSTKVQDNNVPIAVRPGHIRFVSEDGEVGQSRSLSTGRVETLQWNGTTSKKKGQKWGRQNTVFGDSIVDDCNRANHQNASTEETKIMDACKGAIHQNSNTEEAKKINECTNFENFFPLTRSPMEGDVLVYRLVELSSSWCPELSSFRVGKVSAYDTASMKIVLIPVPEYPIVTNENKDVNKSIEQNENENKDVNESAEQNEYSLYKDDGSLEIEYSSLFDVRLLKAYESEVTNLNILANGNMGASINNWELATVNTNSWQSTLATEKKQKTGWDLIEQALSEKKSQLENEGWGTWAQSTATTSWSYRALRGSALGPTLSLLRGNNGQNPASSRKRPPGKSPSSGKSFGNGKSSKF